jgi:hypothetical protein
MAIVNVEIGQTQESDKERLIVQGKSWKLTDSLALCDL